MESGRDFDFITGDFDFFFNQYSSNLILDEAQLSPELIGELRHVIDQDRTHKGRFLITGFSSPELLGHISESLAGRVAIFEIGTLKMNERFRMPLSKAYNILQNPETHEHVEKFKKLTVNLSTQQVLNHFLTGGYPEPSIHEEQDFHDEWMSNYQHTYLNRDVRRLFPGLNLEKYRNFIGMLSGLSGTIINRSEIGRSLNCSESAVRDYLDIASGTFLWRSIPSFESTQSKSFVKMPRGYIRDSGLLHHLQEIRTDEQIFTSAGTGAAFEGFVIEEIIQGLQAVSFVPWEANFFRTRGGAEVDLVLTSAFGIQIPIEIKFGASIRKAQLRSLHDFIQKEECPYGILINNSSEIRQLSPNVIQVPFGCW